MLETRRHYLPESAKMILQGNAYRGSNTRQPAKKNKVFLLGMSRVWETRSKK